MGRAEGQGVGEGHCGETEGSDVAVGASVAVCCTAMFCTCGVPLLIAGVILLVLNFSPNIGIALICVAVALTLVGLLLIVLICSGVLSKKNRTAPQGMTIVNQTNVMSSMQPQTIPNNQTIMPPDYSESTNPPPYAPRQGQPGQSMSAVNNYSDPGHHNTAYPPTAPSRY